MSGIGCEGLLVGLRACPSSCGWFLRGGHSCSFCRSGHLPLGTATRVKQLRLHLLPGKDGVETSAAVAFRPQGHWGSAAGICNIGWHCRGHGRPGVIMIKERTEHSTPSRLFHGWEVVFLKNLLSENQGQFQVPDTKYQRLWDKRSDEAAPSAHSDNPRARRCVCGRTFETSRVDDFQSLVIIYLQEPCLV